ncbi:MAG TPA: ketol-acid reductoisomerase [Solirubrobacterales bacterium]|jgi:ketol-acid reductoisomerase
MREKTIAVLGFGSQGHAHALNLRDSGYEVLVGLRPDSSSVAYAEQEGLKVLPTAGAAAAGDVVVILVPDEIQPRVWKEDVAPGLAAGDIAIFASGFAVHYGFVEPPADVDVALVAPKGPGHLVRRQFEHGSGVPGLIAVHQDHTGNTRELALAYAAGIGCERAGTIETSFKDETETDLFGEQAVLCGGMSALVEAGFEILVEAGYDPRMAYYECVHELKLIVDLVHEKGLAGMRESISNTAEFGDYTRGPRVIDAAAREHMRESLRQIQAGEFAEEWMRSASAGGEELLAMRAQAEGTLLERTGADLRSQMAWLEPPSGAR